MCIVPRLWQIHLASAKDNLQGQCDIACELGERHWNSEVVFLKRNSETVGVLLPTFLELFPDWNLILFVDLLFIIFKGAIKRTFLLPVFLFFLSSRY